MPAVITQMKNDGQLQFRRQIEVARKALLLIVVIFKGMVEVEPRLPYPEKVFVISALANKIKYSIQRADLIGAAWM